MIWGYQEFERDGHKYTRLRWFDGNKVGKGFTAFTPAKDGTVVPLAGGGAARIYRNGDRDYLPGPGNITIHGQERLNAAAGHFDGYFPFGKQIREAALGGPGGVDEDSPEYKNANKIGNGVMTGLLLVTVGGEVEEAGSAVKEAVELAEEVASKGLRNTAAQDAVIQLAKQAKRTGGVTEEEAQTLLNWAREYGVKPARNDIGTDHWVGGDHIHVGPVNHIPVKPN